ncbi:cytochrome C oxidase subunit IV family protein [Nocardia bovistercoris]|uniref:Cytochrome C oxidase subunit IV family protein n=1 Tax=Nocardia bovistercoris TaxID=2785916 RepID=A0A931N2S4_9NOCA|nr:cytochrome C oxidase subunit IV family protein [Nocardia bovistercoris]MBH0776361.1 cytochrome C oxidase subunit IV family protein [Nocardia bovistercoris]
MIFRSITAVWLVLSAITLLSWWLAPGHSGYPTHPSTTITVVVVVLTAIKARMIIRHFMEIRTAPRWLSLATNGWLFALCGAILAIYLW